MQSQGVSEHSCAFAEVQVLKLSGSVARNIVKAIHGPSHHDDFRGVVILNVILSIEFDSQSS